MCLDSDCLFILFVRFFVDDIPIRVFKNCKDLGVKFPFNQPMKIYSSLWNADDWATRGGLEKTDWSKAPFIATYKSFHIDGCESSVEAKFCATQGKRWWDQKEFQDLDSYQYRRLQWVRTKYTIYNYCTDRVRYPTVSPECKRDRDIWFHEWSMINDQWSMIIINLLWYYSYHNNFIYLPHKFMNTPQLLLFQEDFRAWFMGISFHSLVLIMFHCHNRLCFMY